MAEDKTKDTTENNGGENTQTITMTQDEFDKKIQGEGDRVRTEYSKRIKELEAKVKELTPVQKSETEIELEKRVADIEAREARMNLLDSLDKNGISKDFADYFKGDVNVEEFAKVYQSAIDGEVKKKIQENGFVPQEHKSGEQLTKDDFKKMTMDQKEKLFNENPELYRTLSKG